MQTRALKSHQGGTIFYDGETSTFRHDEERHPGWSNVTLIACTEHAGLLVPHVPNAERLARAVRLLQLPMDQCAIVAARCGLGEYFYSARPRVSENPQGYIECADVANDWEIVTQILVTLDLPISAEKIEDLQALLEEETTPADIIQSELDGHSIRWYLALRDIAYINNFACLVAIEQGHAMLRRLARSADRYAIASSYSALADWLDDIPDSNIRFIGKDFDIFDPYPHEVPFDIDFELISRIRQYIQPSKNACVLATMRNEGPYIVEWLAHHIAVGFEHFFIYTNENSDYSDELLEVLARHSGKVTLIHNDARQARPQLKAYGHALKCLPDILAYKWALIADADEFLVLDRTRFSKVWEYLFWIESRPVDAVGLNWLMYQTFGVKTADLSEDVRRRFQKRHKGVNFHIKSVIKPRYFLHSQAHYPFGIRGRINHILGSNGDTYQHLQEPAHSVNPRADAAWINHYWSKSEEEFCAKWSRNGGDLQSSFVRSLSEIDSMRQNVRAADQLAEVVIDERILGFQIDVDEASALLLQLPEVRPALAKTIAKQEDDIRKLTTRLSIEVEQEVDHVS